ncbi:MAG: GNAT family N-acetyltransferase [Dehalococcoidia bacterium]
MADYTIRRMRPEEAQLAIDWATLEGWNPGLQDADAFYRTDPDGFFVGVLDGEVIGTLSGVAYDGGYGFLGLYIVKPEHRGNGYGLGLWHDVTAYLGDRNVGLDSVVAQEANYERSGFTRAYRNVRYEGQRPDVSADEDGIVPLSEVPFEEVLTYDRAVFPVERRDFLERWIAMPNSVALGLQRRDRLAGFGVARKCDAGWKFGPLSADDEGVADALFRALCARLDDDLIYLDVPEPHREAVALAERYGMHPSFETVRMYNHGQPQVDLARIFGVTTFELG